MIRYGDAGSIQGLQALWESCFGDERSYIRAFFQVFYEDRNVLLAEENGVLMGASFFLPGKIYTDQGWQDIRYVYALAVYPQFRGRHIASQLMQRAYGAYRVPLITEPADRELADRFYKPFGFLDQFFLDYDKVKIRVPQYSMQAASLEHISDTSYELEAAEYLRLREIHFKGPGYVDWPLQHVAFAIQEHRKNGGGAFGIRKDDREDILLYALDAGQAIVTETTLPLEEVIGFFQDGRLSQDCQWIVVKNSTGQVREPLSAAVQDLLDAAFHWRRPLGMGYGIALAQGYLNLTLD